MAILEFQKPVNVIMIQSDDHYGKFEFRPLEPGYGVTIGNAIRRVLLSSLEGYAITRIRIQGVDHEFSTIDGVREDVVDIVLNLKQIRFRRNPNSEETSEDIRLTIKGKEQFVAGDLDKALINFEVINKDLVICNLDPSAEINMELTVEKGRGYVPAEQNELPDMPFGTIAIDAIFTPIRNVKYSVENFRVEQKTDYEKLIIEVETDGSISPKDALEEAAKILIYHFSLFSDKKITIETESEEETQEIDEEFLRVRQLLKKRLVDIDLSVRALNCLKAANVHTLGDLVTYKKDDLLKFRNFGKKSLAEIEQLLENYGLDFGMDVSKYRLHEDEENEEQ